MSEPVVDAELVDEEDQDPSRRLENPVPEKPRLSDEQRTAVVLAMEPALRDIVDPEHAVDGAAVLRRMSSVPNVLGALYAAGLLGVPLDPDGAEHGNEYKARMHADAVQVADVLVSAVDYRWPGGSLEEERPRTVPSFAQGPVAQALGVARSCCAEDQLSFAIMLIAELAVRLAGKESR